MRTMDVHEYIARIRYVGDLGPTSSVLAALQEAHLLTVPFENLDIHAGRRIELELPSLFEKIVVRKRGGFCYELNGLFHWLLRNLGFDATLAMARVFDHRRQTYGPEFDHLLILVRIHEQDWIADVGFGDFSMHPLEFSINRYLKDRNGEFLIESLGDGYFGVSRFSHTEQRNVPEYMFSPQPRHLADFVGMCDYHQTSPESIFTRRKVCSISTPTGRITLTGEKLIVTDRGKRDEWAITNGEEFHSALARYFGLNGAAIASQS